MAAILPGRRSKRPLSTPVLNLKVGLGGHTYRVAKQGGHVLLVALRTPLGRERLLDPDGRRAKQVLRALEAQ